jgi:exodeoxyribonuclease VII small subunit
MKKEISKEISFEESLKRLEEIVSKLEGGDLPLDVSLRLFEEGASLSIICTRKLDETEQKLLKISANSSGNPIDGYAE